MRRTRYAEPDTQLIQSMQKGISIPGADLPPAMSNFAVEYAISGDVELALSVSQVETPVLRKNRNLFIRELLEDPAVQAVIASIRADKTITNLITHEKIQHEYAKIAFADVAECYDENDRLKPIRKMPHYIRAAISEVKTSTTIKGEGREKETTFKTIIKFHNKMEALKILNQTNEIDKIKEIPVYNDNRKVVNINVSELTDKELIIAGKLIDIEGHSSIRALEHFEDVGAR